MGAQRPKYPPLFLEEIFRSRRYRQDFRRFLVKHDVVAPLHFLEAASGLKFFRHGSAKQLAHTQKIHKKFFGKESNFGRKLNCDDKTIHLIAEAETVSPMYLLAAFIPVYRSMEKIWFKKYLQTFPGKVPKIREVEISPTEAETDKANRRPSYHAEWGENISHSHRTVRKLFQFIIKLQSTPVHRQMIDYVRILYEEETEQMKAVLRPRLKTGSKETDKFEETISGLKRGDLPNLERRILFLYDMIQYKTLYNCLNQYGGVYNEKHSLLKKARLIINKYLDPKTGVDLLLGVPQKLTIEARMSFKREGLSRTLFHELTLLLLPAVFNIWKTMKIECTKCGGKAAFSNLIRQKQQHLSSEETVNMLNNLKKETIIPTNDHHAQFITLNFSLQKGIRVYVPKQTTGKDEKAFPRVITHRMTRDGEKEAESTSEVRGGSRLGYVLIK